MLSAFGRHQAPVIRMPNHLSTGQNKYLLSATFPNRKSHPLINDWIVVGFNDGHFEQLDEFDDFLQQIDLGAITLSNPGTVNNTQVQQQLLIQAIDKAKQHFDQVRNAHEKALNSKLQQQVDELEKLRTKRIQQMSLQLEDTGGIKQIIEDKKHKEQQRIEKLFDDYIQWIEDTMTTEKEPYIQVIAVFTGAQE